MKKHFCLFLIFSLFFFSCATNNQVSDFVYEKNSFLNFKTPSSVEPEWNFLNSYSSTFDFTINEPRAVCHAIKIDLTDSNLKISSYPPPADFPVKDLRPEFLAENNDIVINTVPYSQKIKPFSKKIPAGILYTHSVQFSKPLERYCALCVYITPDGYRCKIEQTQTAITEDKKNSLYCVHGGFWQIIKDGIHIDFKDIKDSRTAVGISKDEKTLYILIVEGEKKSVSKGLSYGDCADIFDCFGVFNAMEFDGGSSTTLYINGKNALSYHKKTSLPAFLGFQTAKFDK
ncbi:MAG: phosphodiester glycosidase family protein [Treponema sp.]|nr:phosphodiester glycosidase family protein [Treponema sp.]